MKKRIKEWYFSYGEFLYVGLGIAFVVLAFILGARFNSLLIWVVFIVVGGGLIISQVRIPTI